MDRVATLSTIFQKTINLEVCWKFRQKSWEAPSIVGFASRPQLQKKIVFIVILFEHICETFRECSKAFKCCKFAIEFFPLIFLKVRLWPLRHQLIIHSSVEAGSGRGKAPQRQRIFTIFTETVEYSFELCNGI